MKTYLFQYKTIGSAHIFARSVFLVGAQVNTNRLNITVLYVMYNIDGEKGNLKVHFYCYSLH